MVFFKKILNEDSKYIQDAWGSLSEYIKTHNAFPQPFIDWFDTIFQIYQEKEESGEKIIQCDNFLRLYLKAGLTEEDAMRAFTQISAVKFHLNKSHI
jgi:hypothetical protein